MPFTEVGLHLQLSKIITNGRCRIHIHDKYFQIEYAVKKSDVFRIGVVKYNRCCVNCYCQKNCHNISLISIPPYLQVNNSLRFYELLYPAGVCL